MPHPRDAPSRSPREHALKATIPRPASPLSPTAAQARRGLVNAFAIVVSIKLAWLVADPSLRFFLGDSGSYFHTAITGWIPPDRSFLYGWLIADTALPAQSAATLVTLQAVFGIAVAMLLYAWLAFGARVRLPVAYAAAALLATEPAQIFYERMMMAEAASLLAFAMFFVCLSLYVASGRWRWIVSYAAFGVLAVGLRISFLPVVLVASLIAPAVRSLCVREPDRGRPLLAWLRLGLHMAIALACTMYAHGAYKRWYGELSQTPAAYTAMAGVFRLGLVAPLVRPEHFRNTGVSPDALDLVTLPLDDPRNREMQVWSAGGLVDVLRKQPGDLETTARKISIRAARSDPFALVRMGFANVADYFDPEVAGPRMEDDLARRPIHPTMIGDLRRHLRYDATGLHQHLTPALRLFEGSGPWLVFCLLGLVPLALAALWLGWNAPRREVRVLLALVSIGLVAGHVLFSHIVSYRYLHPLPWFVLANAALLAQAIYERKTQKRELV
jgi:hypothetical protein